MTDSERWGLSRRQVLGTLAAASLPTVTGTDAALAAVGSQEMTPEEVVDAYLTDNHANGYDGPDDIVDAYDDDIDSLTINVGPDGNLRFDPVAVRIDAAKTVAWEWQSDGHSVEQTDSDLAFEDTPIQNEGATHEHTFESAGVFLYQCGPHSAQGHHGAIIIESSTGTVAGTVTDSEGNPLEGISIGFLGDGFPTVTTDASGTYEIELTVEDPPDQNAMFTASPEYEQFRSEVSVEPDTTTTVDIELAPAEEFEWQFGANFSVFSSPTIVDNTVFIGSGHLTIDWGRLDGERLPAEAKRVYALDAGTGEKQWEYETGHMAPSSPTVVDGTVYVGSFDGNVYALDADSGDEQWRFETDDVVVSSPTLWDGTLYVGSNDGNLYALETTTGEERWRFETEFTVASSPTVVEGTVYFGSWPESVPANPSVYALDADTGEELWRFDSSGGVFSSPTVENDTIYFGVDDFGVYALDAETGNTQWEYEVSGTTDMISSPTVADGTVFIGGGRTNRVYALDADTGEEQWEFQAASIQSSPTVVEDTVFVGAGDFGVYALDVENGEKQWEYYTNGQVWSSPTVVDGSLFIGSGLPPEFIDREGDSLEAFFERLNGNVYALDAGVERSSEGSRVMLGTLGHHGDSNPPSTSGGGDTSGGDDGGTDDDDGTESTDDGGSSDDSSDASDDGTDSDASGDGGLGTGEMAAIGGGGGLALLFGAYALMRRAGDDSDADSTPEKPVEPNTQDSRTTAATAPQSPDSYSENTIDDLLDDVTQTLDSARRSRDSRDYDRALARCYDAIDTAKEAQETARRDAAGRVADAEDALDDATALREAIEAERDASQRASDALDTAEQHLDDAREALDEGSPRTALDHLEGLPARLDDVRDSIGEYDLADLRDRLDNLDERRTRLREAAENVLTNVPATVPTAPGASLTYDDIQKGELLGRGGNADVFHATAQIHGDPVEFALKEPRVGGTLHTETVERMLEEAETWQQLDDHDHIVGVVDYGSEPLPWIAMEYMDGGHLGDQSDEMDLSQKLWTAIAVTEGVEHAHRRGVAHRDLKPENILFRAVDDAWDAPKVADWGLSKHLLRHSKSRDGMTVEYAAPEQFDDDAPTDDRTDIYQLGAVFYELFTGQPPFEGELFAVMEQVKTGTPTPPSEIADVPAELDKVLLQALAKDREQRHNHVVYLRDDLQDLFSQS